MLSLETRLVWCRSLSLYLETRGFDCLGEQHEDKGHGLSRGGATDRPFSRQPGPTHSLPQRPPSGLVAPATVARQRSVVVALETEKPSEIRGRQQRGLSQHDGVN